MNNIKSPDQLVSEMDEIIRGMWTHLEDPENLSTDILRLAVLNVGIGNALVEAQDLLNVANTEYKHSFETFKLAAMQDKDENGKKVTATAAESMATVEMKEAADYINVLTKALMTLKIKRQDTDSVIDAARSRLSLIKNDIKQS